MSTEVYRSLIRQFVDASEAGRLEILKAHVEDSKFLQIVVEHCHNALYSRDLKLTGRQKSSLQPFKKDLEFLTLQDDDEESLQEKRRILSGSALHFLPIIFEICKKYSPFLKGKKVRVSSPVDEDAVADDDAGFGH
jgi:hypothetical protein